MGESITRRKEEEARGKRQSAELHTSKFTLGAKSTAVKQYNVSLDGSKVLFDADILQTLDATRPILSALINILAIVNCFLHEHGS